MVESTITSAADIVLYLFFFILHKPFDKVIGVCEINGIILLETTNRMYFYIGKNSLWDEFLDPYEQKKKKKQTLAFNREKTHFVVRQCLRTPKIRYYENTHTTPPACYQNRIFFISEHAGGTVFTENRTTNPAKTDIIFSCRCSVKMIIMRREWRRRRRRRRRGVRYNRVK